MSKRADGSYSNAWRGVSKIILRPTIRALMKFDWQGHEHFIPAGRGMIVAANHLSYADVLALALFCDKAGRYPTFLAKSSLFKIKVLGPIITKLGQLPVYRNQADAALVLRDAEQGVRDGACVVFYPEATEALATGAPVVPVGHWGAQYILPYGSVKPHVIPRKTVHMIAGPPVDLSEFAGMPLDTPTLRAATDKIMTEVAALVGKLRGEVPPATPFHPAVARRQQRAELRQLAQQQPADAAEPEFAAADGGGQSEAAQPEAAQPEAAPARPAGSARAEPGAVAGGPASEGAGP